jgi:hypothetical protein
MNGSLILLITGGLVVFAAVVAIVVQWFRAFYTVPVQATIRALIGLLALLVGALGVPTIEGDFVLSLDWGALLNVQETTLRISTGSPLIVTCLAWGSVTLLLGLSLNLVPKVMQPK